MSLIINSADFIQKNWTLVKNNLYPFWDKLTKKDKQSINNYETLVEKLKEKYNLPADHLDKKLTLFVISLQADFLNENLSKLKSILHKCTYEDQKDWENSFKK